MNENYVQRPAWNDHCGESGVQNAENIQHDVAEERRIIAEGKVGLMLLAMLSAGRISNVLHGVNDGNFFRCQHFKIVTRPYKRLLSESNNLRNWVKVQKQDFLDILSQGIKIMNNKSLQPNFDDTTVIDNDTQLPVPYGTISQQISRIKLDICEMQDQVRQVENCSSVLYQSGYYYQFCKVFYNNNNGQECIDCPVFLQIISGLCNCNNSSCADYKNLHNYLSQPPMPNLIDIFAIQEGITTEEAVEKLMDNFGIKLDEPFATIPIPETANAHQIKNIRQMPDHPDFRNILFISSANSLLGAVAVNKTVENNRVVVPLTAWSFSGSNDFFFPVPFDKPYPLLNWNLIVQNPDAEIFLCESIELADVNTNKYQYNEIIWTAWLGGKETASDVNWEILRNRKVTIVIHNNSKDSVESVLSAYFSLKSIASVTIEFQN